MRTFAKALLIGVAFISVTMAAGTARLHHAPNATTATTVSRNVTLAFCPSGCTARGRGCECAF